VADTPLVSSQQEANMSTMTLDKTSRPGQTGREKFKAGRDELVPSRYALRVGEIDVLVVSDGVIQISAETMAPNADPAVLSAWLHDRFLPEWVEWSLNQVVVTSGGRTILIDSGLGKDRRYRSRIRDRRGAHPHAL
jgi:hypothetical protein